MIKYKLNDDVKDFIKSIVKPEFVDDYITDIENKAKDIENLKIGINCGFTKSGISLTIYLYRNDRFTTVEELNPYVWYPAEKWNGNPNNYILVEMTDNGNIYCVEEHPDRLYTHATHFMFLKRRKE